MEVRSAVMKSSYFNSYFIYDFITELSLFLRAFQFVLLVRTIIL